VIKVLRLTEVRQLTGLSRSGVYSKLRRNPRRPHDFDETFPRQFKLGARAVGWSAQELDDWLKAQVERREASAASEPS
jgi:prophage regulatory protein